MDGWRHGWMDARMDSLTDRQMDELFGGFM